MKRLVVYINLPQLIFHVLFFLRYKERCYGDIIACKALRRDLGGGKNVRLYDLCYLLVFDKAFRALFYFRIGHYKYLIWYWFKPDPSFIIATDMIMGSYAKLVHPFATIINAKKLENILP